MPDTQIPRGEFCNPCPHLSNPVAKAVVDELLSTVTRASERFGEPTEADYKIADCYLFEVQDRLLVHRDLTLPHLVEARIRLAVKASLTTHCLTAFPYEHALQEAESYQARITEHGDDVRRILDRYPLFGLVFSVKDCIHVQGLPTTLGCSSRAGQKQPATADLVQKLRDAGAIMIAKTTAPQLMMSNTTHSPLWGTTRSPMQSAAAQAHLFQVGGSSGGEASLVKMGGSQLGVGTDMGGSVRQPACLNELYGYKFTSRPVKYRWKLPHDFMTGLPHTQVPATAPGLLARDLFTIKHVVETLQRDDSESPVDEAEPKEIPDYPRIVYTAQHSSPEVHALVHRLVRTIRDIDEPENPTKCEPLGELDLQAWGETWTEYAKQHGFDEARAMLRDDPLITRTLFDESRLCTASSNESWKPDPDRLAQLKATFCRQAGIHAAAKGDAPVENVVIITPTYILGGPVHEQSFVQLDNAGESEVWCQIFNLLDWPAISVPLPDLPPKVRRTFREKAVASPEWAQHLPSLVKSDPICDSGQERLVHLSLQLVTLPGNEAALLDFAHRLGRSHRHVRKLRAQARAQQP